MLFCERLFFYELRAQMVRILMPQTINFIHHVTGKAGYFIRQ